MGKKHHHGTKYIIKDFLESETIKTIVTMLFIEFALFLFVVYKGLGLNYLPITCVIMFFTMFSCVLAFRVGADRYLLIIILILINLGFVVQEVESGSGVEVSGFLLKFSAAIVTAFMVAFLYRYFVKFLADDKTVFEIMGVQLFLCMMLYLLGTKIGDVANQGATLTIRIGGISFTPFELVKVLYLFVAAALLCKEEKIYIGKQSVQREVILVIHTIVLSIFSFLCRELGTFLVIYLTGLAMLWIFGKNREAIIALVLVTAVGVVSMWVVCDRILYPMVVSNKISLPGILEKLVKRFGTVYHPEQAMSGAGYQGTLALEALAIGGLLGIETERHRLTIPEASSDMIFANVIQTCGFLMGAIMLVLFFALLKRGVEIALNSKELYLQGLAMAITLMLTIECAIHIGYNIGILPITGIPLYFVSQGFTAIITAMALAVILLVISAGVVKGKVK